jgi:acetyltransferase-like isoleucine patch superfamily enzyme
MIVVFFKLLHHIMKRFLRQVYWLYRLSNINIGKNVSFHFPVICEGSGNITIGNNCQIGKRVKLAAAKGSNIKIGNNCRIDDEVEFIIDKNASLIIEDNCWVMKGTILRTSKKIHLKSNVQIATKCSIFSREGGYDGELIVGKGTHIGDNTIIDLSDRVIIDDEVAIGPNCTFYTHDHDYHNSPSAVWKGEIKTNEIFIHQGSWIASNVIILPGVVICQKSIVAAGAVVSQNTESNAIYGGIPAKKIKSFT